MKDLFVTANGLSDTPGKEPDRVEIETCKKWLAEFARKRKSINDRRWSYSLKHTVERWADLYISNGAFIQAAIELGYNYKRVQNGLNANFDMIFPRRGTNEYKRAFESK